MKEMHNKYRKEISKKNNFLVLILGIFILGLIFGSIYITILDKSEKTLIINSVGNYFNEIKSVSFDNGINVFKNSLISNLLYNISMWLLGLSAIGLPVIIIMVFFKSFVLSFSVSSIIAKYGFKGILGALLYIFPSPLITGIFSIILGTYSMIISVKLIRSAFTKQTINFKSFMGKYFFILLISILVSVLCALIDAFASPYILKLFTNFIK